MNATLGPGGRGRALSTRIAIAATLVVAAVATASGVAAGSAPTAHDGSAAEPVKLTFMSNAQSAGIESAWAELIAAYEKANPNVTITRVPVAYANYKTTAKLRASSSSAPDLIEGDSSPGGILASLATPGLLLPVDKYAAKYNWKKTFGPLIRQLYLSKDGTKVGSGNIYGVPDFAEILGVFYNKSILAKLGLKQPKTFAEFEASLQKAKSAGVTPLMIGGLDKWPWIHAYALLADHFASPSALINWYNARPGASIVSPGTTKAATVLQQWVKNGYFEDGANGVSDGDAVARFGKGLSLYKIDGPWETEVNTKALGKNAGFFLLPAAKAGVTPPSTGSMGWDVAITAKSKNPDAAATFLNFLTTKTARTIIMKHQNPPGAPGPASGSGAIRCSAPSCRATHTCSRTGISCPTWTRPILRRHRNDMLANVQSMAAGKMSPADFLQELAGRMGWLPQHQVADVSRLDVITRGEETTDTSGCRLRPAPPRRA